MKIMEGLEKNVHVSKQTTPPTPLNHACIKAAKKIMTWLSSGNAGRYMFICKNIEATMASWVFKKISQNTKCNAWQLPLFAMRPKDLTWLQKICCKNDKLFSANIGFECFCLKNAVWHTKQWLKSSCYLLVLLLTAAWVKQKSSCCLEALGPLRPLSLSHLDHWA